ncbi:MAG: hypothetical protein AB7K09_10385 [Planctomycetota bacterium]
MTCSPHDTLIHGIPLRLAMTLTWIVTSVIAVAGLVFTWSYLLAPASPPASPSPAYVPTIDELPQLRVASEASWDNLRWTAPQQAMQERSINSARYRRLVDADWDMQPMPRPMIVGPAPTGHERPPEPPTQAMAEAELAARLDLRAFLGPARIVVALRSAPATEYALVGPDAFARYLTDINVNPKAPRDPASFAMHNDLAALGLPVRVLAITDHDCLVEYTCRGQAFRILIDPAAREK